MNKLWLRTLWHFDRSYNSSRVWQPLLWPLGLCLALIVLFGLIGLCWPSSAISANNGGHPRLVETTGLLLSPGTLPLSSSMPYLLQIIIAFAGLLLVTAFLIATVSHILTRRSDSYLQGLTRYWFNNHILILGGSHTTVSLLKTIADDENLRHKDIVILSTLFTPILRDSILQQLTPQQRQLSLVFYHGSRNLDDDLRSCQIENASHIFILGEDNEKEHDALNIDCWNKLHHLRSNAIQMAQCHLSLNHNISTQILQSLPQESHTTLETTLFNHFETIALQTLAGSTDDTAHLTLDRGLVTPDSQRYVHFVIVGMTQMGYAMAAAAAQLCHFPNFDSQSKAVRTRITLIDPDSDTKIDYFKAHYNGLFNLSHITLRTSPNTWQTSHPDSSMGDFLDIEWEFIKGTIMQEWVRTQLDSYLQDDRQVVSVALCGDNPDLNLAEAFYLPPQYFPLDDDESPLSVTPLVYVHLTSSAALADAARHDVPRYHNVIPFGMACNGYDPLMSRRIATAKRLNYLYHREKTGKPFSAMPTDANTLDELWRQLSFAEKASVIHAADSLQTKFRSLGLTRSVLTVPIDNQALVDTLARMEQNRLNLEHLLAGYAPLPTAERNELNSNLQSTDETIRQNTILLNKRNRNLRFTLNDITPYDSLPDDSRQYLCTIARYLTAVY